MPVINLIVPKDEAPVTFEPFNEDFRQFAIKLHGTQTYDGMPYAYHLACVENVLCNGDYTSYEDRAVAWFHDLFEDTDATFQEVASYYSANIALYAEACTGRGETRKIRNTSIYRKLQENPKAAKYKVADRIANMKHGILSKSLKLEMYIKEFKGFSEAIRPLMMSDTKDRLMWNSLEGVVTDACKLYRTLALAA